MFSEKSNRAVSRILITLAICNIAFLICYICFAYKYHFHADSAVANTLAQEIRDTGKFFPPKWRYANGDVWVLFLHAFTVPVLAVLPNGYPAHAAVSLLGAALILAVVWQLCTVASMSRRAHWAALALIACGVSPNMAENLFGQQAYGILFWIGALILMAAWKFFQIKARLRYAWAAVALLLIFLAAWGNPQRAFAYMVLPTLFGAVAAHLLGTHAASAGPRGPSRGAIALFAVAALIVSVLGAREQHAALALNEGLDLLVVPAWLSFDGMMHNLLAALRGMLSLLGGFPEPGTAVATGEGLLAAARFGAAITVLCLLPWGVWQALHSKHAGRVYFGVAAAVSLIVSLVIYVTTTVPYASDAEASIRYVVPGVVGALLLLVPAVADSDGGSFKRAIGLLAAMILVLSAPLSYGLNGIGGVGMAARDDANELMATVRFLQGQHAQYGYASYWNAGNTTVLSDHAVKIRQIIIANGLPRPQRFLSSDTWYEPANWQGPSFLFLTKPEDAQVNWQDMAKLCGEPSRRVIYKNMVYIEYGHNIARDLPLWSLSPEVPVRFPATAGTPHVVGEFIAATGELRAAQGQAGVLRYGPYGMLVPGRYKATFELDADYDGGDLGELGYVDVIAEIGNITLAKAAIERGGRQSLVLSFTVTKKLNNVEYRIFTNGKGAVAWSNVTVQGEALPPTAQGTDHVR